MPLGAMPGLANTAVLGFVGHRQTRLSQNRNVLQDQLETVLRAIQTHSPSIVLTSGAADGSDLLAGAAARHLGMPWHAITLDDNEIQAARDTGATRIEALNETAATSPNAPFVALQSRILDSADLILALWDGQPSRGAGGTADTVAQAGRRKLPVLWLASQSNQARLQYGALDHWTGVNIDTD